ncbi:MAG: SpaH/EbpB family LPXTG-anchored major pilin [Lactobacillus sp.]|jgi:LPXTG-motif cell wall-anchored protein|uniref:SpaH/EbpB family LPXTG-anchored major pilin n=1 Tax=Lacticaseibacillus suilingensis TaxID=2799577 RepID=A0ABW4BHC9_9LACO|nr:SpaH/EbpB family LPXTG-anchored major pilin [Lacticaseibacillus suilingensis]MCI1894307.1 SpaH/EbpB family LPXTG-anchored major pilin [Lactobacillus sp.]MCI1916848.1 SpaH/EbpB family LPXTG-anchored major pilin [Lactobacillus sp.]MCI1942052.1 SpaH/EbpB family LPXTG-anchored major pilin [Lactobacillus sp.]MCI1972485.1 SpaH/EbpB family LPXTG-anchored major pilin [Lactobacillus sp.]MCI2017740.1 SpaH/EbpB family LPXTG-anchored major pilin [Lactobacillus sp.]
MKKVDYKTRLFHTLAVSGLVLGSLGAMTVPLMTNTNIIRTHAAATPVPDDTSERSITVHKYDGGASTTPATGTDADEANLGSRNPLANVSFTVQKVTPTNGAKNMDPTDATTYTTVGDPQTITTDTNGAATANLGTGNANDGYYLITEQQSPSLTDKSAPFFVRVPLTQTGTSGADATLVYDVNVYPKGETETVDLSPVKTFTDSSQLESLKVGADVSWNLTVATPKDIYTPAAGSVGEVYANSLVISDPIDTNSLDFKAVDSVKLVGGPNDGTALTETTDYTVDSTKTKTNGDTTYTVVQISLTQAGMKKAAGSTNIVAQITTTTKANGGDAKIVNTFDTYYVPATNVPGHQTTVPTDNLTPGSTTDPSDPSVPTDPDTDDSTNPTIKFGNIDVLKTDDTSDAKPLANASFRLAASEADAKAGTWITDNNDQVITVTTDSDGRAQFNGLAVDPTTGTKDYYLVETDAPAGYDIDGTIYQVTATQDSTIDKTIQDADNMLPNLPMTGSDARLLLLVTATVLIVGSGSALYIKRRRRQAKEEA